MNTVPYTNARREGRTNPDKVEMIGADDPRHPSHPSKRPAVNRSVMRGYGVGVRRPRRMKARHPHCEDCGRPVPTYRTPPVCGRCVAVRQAQRHE